MMKMRILVLFAFMHVSFFTQGELFATIHKADVDLSKVEFENLVDMQEQMVKLYADRVMFYEKVDGEYKKETTYAQFGKSVDVFRSALSGLGLGLNDRVAILGNNSSEWAIACYASLGAGAAVIGMYWQEGLDQWTFKIKNSGAKVVIVPDRKVYELMKGLIGSAEAPNLLHVIAMKKDDQAPEMPNMVDLMQSVQTVVPSLAKQINGNQMMGLIYTSGTSGVPKGAMLSHENICFLLKRLPKLVPGLVGKKSANLLTWAHIFGQVAELHALIFFGNSTAFIEVKKQPKNREPGEEKAEEKASLAVDMAVIKPQILFAVPKVFEQLIASIRDQSLKVKDSDGIQEKIRREFYLTWKSYSDKKAQGIQPNLYEIAVRWAFASLVKGKLGGNFEFAVCGGSKLDRKIAQQLVDLDITVLEGYGMSESAGIIAMNAMGAGNSKPGSVGRAFPDVRIELDLTKGTKEGEGEILVSGPNIMQGYFNLPAKTGEVLKDGFLLTGDLGVRDEDGFIFITGRASDIYKLDNGKYVDPEHFEAKARQHPYFDQAFLYGGGFGGAMGRSKNVAVLSLKMEPIHELAAQLGVSAATNEELLKDPKIFAAIEKEVKAISSDVDHPWERPQNFHLTADSWTPDNQLLTPTLKLRRASLYARYKDIIEAMFSSN